ncbi:MAG: multicopper oxidase domain-containing protein [Anaerolineales bacterium]|nr:multicopper oxidase domain-containing protein [Anaerolineales bacterium]
MTKKSNRRKLSRRDFLKFAGGTLATAAGASLIPRYMGKNVLNPSSVEVASAQSQPPDLYMAGTDGWIYLPPSPPIYLAGSQPGSSPPIHPDDLAPAPFNAYMFGFRNITGFSETQKLGQKMKAQHSAPLFWVNQYDPNNPVDFRLQLTNLGLAMRPDLIDAHTLHWHGFRNAIPFFDGEPAGSVSVPIGRDFTYVYRPHEPGTYMYHCHVEDVEHVHMGMTGLVFVRPLQDGNTTLYASGKYAYNDGDGSTGFDREFAMFLSEFWAESHWADSHVQLPEWSDYKADFYMLNGRVYPDTLAPNAPINEAASLHYLAVETDATGDLLPPPGRPDLQYQPHSSLVTCNAGERVLLRFANLGFERQSMSLAGIEMKVVGKDATLLRSDRDGTDFSFSTNTIPIGAGESYDVIFEAPAYQGPGPYDTYLLYNRNYRSSNNLDGSGYGGQMTEVHVYPAGTLGDQSLPNT